MFHNAFKENSLENKIFTVFSEDSESFVILFLRILLRHAVLLGSLEGEGEGEREGHYGEC